MTADELTWERVREIAAMAMAINHDFTFRIDANGYMSIETSAPTCITNTSESVIMPVEEAV